MLNIRTCTLQDEADIVDICHITGDTSIDKTLFALKWCLYYVWYETENCFVVEDTDRAKVVGYILGTLDTEKQTAAFDRIMLPKMKAHWRSMPHKTLKNRRDYLTLRAINTNSFSYLYAQYPAHLHINLHPDYQRQGLGHKLFTAYEDNLIQKGIPGYHLVVGGDNATGISFYKKLGLEELGDFTQLGKTLAIAYGKRFI